MAEKYPAKFDDALYALVLRTKRADGLLFGGVLRIVRRPAGMVAVEGLNGATFTFEIETDEKGKECGHLLQAVRQGNETTRFRVIPFNKMAEDYGYSPR